MFPPAKVVIPNSSKHKTLLLQLYNARSTAKMFGLTLYKCYVHVVCLLGCY